MNTTHILGVCALALALAIPTEQANAGLTDSEGTQLMAKYNCQGCHALDRKLVGPGFKEVAKKYAGDQSAVEKLAQKIKTGGGGVWGPIPMPPTNVPDGDRNALTAWILSLK